MIEQPKIIEGGLAVDVRGQLSFINDLEGFVPKRFYIVQNHQQGYIRAFHGHQTEAKMVYIFQGAALFYLIKTEDFEIQLKKKDLSPADWVLAPVKYILSDRKPQALFIPPGYFNGFKTLTADTKLMFLSSKTLIEAKGDDFRIPWDIASSKIWDIDYY